MIFPPFLSNHPVAGNDRRRRREHKLRWLEWSGATLLQPSPCLPYIFRGRRRQQRHLRDGEGGGRGGTKAINSRGLSENQSADLWAGFAARWIRGGRPQTYTRMFLLPKHNCCLGQPGIGGGTHFGWAVLAKPAKQKSFWQGI